MKARSVRFSGCRNTRINSKGIDNTLIVQQLLVLCMAIRVSFIPFLQPIFYNYAKN